MRKYLGAIATLAAFALVGTASGDASGQPADDDTESKEEELGKIRRKTPGEQAIEFSDRARKSTPRLSRYAMTRTRVPSMSS